MGQPTVAELDRQAFQALRTLHLKVFPPNQRNHGVFLDQDLRLKSLIKDADCSDLAIREAWESFVSTIVLSRSQTRREGTPANRREPVTRRLRPYQAGDLLRIFEANDYSTRRMRDRERTIYAPPDDDGRDLEIVPLESPDSPWRTGWNWVHNSSRTRSTTPEDEPPRELALASPRARSASPDPSPSASGAWLAEWETANSTSAARSRPENAPTLRRRHRFHAHRPRSEAQRSRTFDELHGHYRRDMQEAAQARRARESATEGTRGGSGRDTRRDGVVFPDSWMNAVESWEEDYEADFWSGASMARSRPHTSRGEHSERRGPEGRGPQGRGPEGQGQEGRGQEGRGQEGRAEEGQSTRGAEGEGAGQSERLTHVEVPRYGATDGAERRIAPLPRRARDSHDEP